jgi:hypothetical protein
LPRIPPPFSTVSNPVTDTPGSRVFLLPGLTFRPPCTPSRTCNRSRTVSSIRGKLRHPRVTRVTEEKHPSGVPVRDNVSVSGHSEPPVTLPSTTSKTSPTTDHSTQPSTHASRLWIPTQAQHLHQSDTSASSSPATKDWPHAASVQSRQPAISSPPQQTTKPSTATNPTHS